MNYGPDVREELLTGLDYLDAVTALLQRVRRAHRTAGLYEAAELQWWWADAPPSNDDRPQLFWFDESGHPAAAAIVTDWGERHTLDPILMPDPAPGWVAHVMAHGLARARESGVAAVGLEVDSSDEVLQDVLRGHGFAIEEDGLVEAWLAAGVRPEISALHGDYRLLSRSETVPRAHHMNDPGRNHPDVEVRLSQTSLYRPDLDLAVFDSHDRVAAYGLFWLDPETDVGVVEPMRTKDEHQRRGIARHVLTTGINSLAQAGADRIKICFEPGNQPARDLYLGVGFEPGRQNVFFSGSTSIAAS